MKKQPAAKASSSFLGILLAFSLLGTSAIASYDTGAALYAACKEQWMQFSEQFSMAQPHRIHFPH